ncbi:MAG: fluoride efflux transporter CrcB [Alphaproteobacteria bacterium]|nr:fluoride efflux transporter CrcB [Alphaproteobacteria bacterium]
MIYIWIALGSALGGMARYWCSEFVAANVGETFPWGTLIVNIIGSFIIGLFVAITGPDGRFIINQEIRLFITIGVCGGFTTFSSFSIQTLNLVLEGDFLRAGANIILSVSLCLIFVWLGYILATSINQLNPIKQ